MRKILLLVAGVLTMVACKEKEVKHQNDNEYCGIYSTLEIPSRKPESIYIEQEYGLISFRLEKNGKVIKYEEMYNFYPLDSNEVKLLIKWVIDDATNPVVSNFKNALMKRLELDRYEKTLNNNY